MMRTVTLVVRATIDDQARSPEAFVDTFDRGLSEVSQWFGVEHVQLDEWSIVDDES